MAIPQQQTLIGTRLPTDGGTTVVAHADGRAGGRSVMLVHPAIADGNTFGKSDRLYPDGEPVEVRSDNEFRLIAILRSANFSRPAPATERPAIASSFRPTPTSGATSSRKSSRGPKDNVRGPWDHLIEWTESPRHVSFTAEDDQARGKTDPSTLKLHTSGIKYSIRKAPHFRDMHEDV